MRRSRTALTAWPAFADLMTVLAVLGLAIAAGVASIEAPDDEVPEDLPQKLKAELSAVRERNAALEERIEELEDRDIERRLGSFPCLGTQSGSRTAPVPLLRIVVESGYRVTRLWPSGANVEGIPRLDEAIAQGLMQEGRLAELRQRHARVRGRRRHLRPLVPLLGRAPEGRDHVADDLRAGAGHREPVLPDLQLGRSEPDSRGDRARTMIDMTSSTAPARSPYSAVSRASHTARWFRHRP